MLNALKGELKNPDDNQFGKALEMRSGGGNGSGPEEGDESVAASAPPPTSTITVINNNDQAIKMIEKMQRDLKRGK